eukprot:3904429-Rhodomonas_salina.1
MSESLLARDPHVSARRYAPDPRTHTAKCTAIRAMGAEIRAWKYALCTRVCGHRYARAHREELTDRVAGVEVSGGYHVPSAAFAHRFVALDLVPQRASARRQHVIITARSHLTPPPTLRNQFEKIH